VTFASDVTAQLVNVHERGKGRPAFVCDAHVDVGRVHLEEQFRHPCERRRSPRVDTRLQSGRPCELDQIAVVGGVIRMLVGDEDVP
jgi:hypothetical protein